MQIATYEKEGTLIINIIGEVDLYNAPKIKEVINDTIKKNFTKFIINMNEVTYIDSTGIGSLIFARQTILAAKGSLRLINIKDSVKKIFELTKLNNFFTIYNSESEAIASFSK
ncbi:MAG: anti-anti-sigma factor [Spirochaetes bacterium GWF1_31_7]|nr:MAG: anti-anti-sigma factor [Spirochaetes bacterium GWE1_32_154]OHD45231.1 MAG: anti-anti-sigma factor [Spirochaetes bacterium GWE2_31_10]OHD50526.1 MAG: anti-anti-sigma factor [Spirochaetes bacterium GWF1_31_7]OHD79139.1 MAG: anti-anti-sigma factor [Spirochaetes bacterium RIFOXYB1_FULL_32_8]HBD94175.1 anti-sigma factor antagonist [Spirochaetia bacterium]